MKHFKIVLWLILALNFLSINCMNQADLGQNVLWSALNAIKHDKSNGDFCRNIVEELLKNDVSPNSISPISFCEGTIPLIFAISILDPELIKLLIKYKVDLNLIDPLTGEVAIHKILDFLESTIQTDKQLDYMIGLKIFNLLLTGGANLDVTNLNGETAQDRCEFLF